MYSRENFCELLSIASAGMEIVSSDVFIYMAFIHIPFHITEHKYS